MNTMRKRILSFLCALCMFASTCGDVAAAVPVRTEGTAGVQTMTASDGGACRVTVRCGPDTGIPEDAEVTISEIGEQDAGYAEYVSQSAEKLGMAEDSVLLARAFQITLKNPRTGEEYQPDRDVQVSLRLPWDDLDQYDNVDVVHIHGDDEEQADVLDTAVRGETVEFLTDGFSVYVVVASDDQTVLPQCTYTFHVWDEDGGEYKAYSFVDDQGREIFRQTVKSGKELVVPQLPSTENEVFAGWYQGSIAGGDVVLDPQPYDFDSITITEDSAVDLYAYYQKYAYVIFHDQYDSDDNTFPIAYTRRAELTGGPEAGEETAASAAIKIDDLQVAYNGSGENKMAFYGWSRTPITTPGAGRDDEGDVVEKVAPDEDGCIVVTEDIDLYPIYKNVNWLTLYTAQAGLSASYEAPACHFDGDSIPTPLPEPSRDGYIFEGWYTGTLNTETVGDDEIEIVDYDSGIQITDEKGKLASQNASSGDVYIAAGELFLQADAVLYARWKANYRVVIWRQKAGTDSGVKENYEYVETFIRSADIGETVSVLEEDRSLGGSGVYAGYQYGWCDEEKIIGNTKELTVLNVYYNLTDGYEPNMDEHTLTFEDSVKGAGESRMPSPVTGLVYGTGLTKPADPSTSRVSDKTGEAIYTFGGWYMDQACTIPADLDAMTMPDRNLTVYAGWNPVKFRVDIDTNYGALAVRDGDGPPQGSGATYFSNTYDDDPIREYTHVTRDYVASSAGKYYFVNHDRAYGGDRFTYYTLDPGLATEDTTFIYAKGTYTYAGWYEVDSDGREADKPYDFSQRTDHDTRLRLHWKKSGVYYLAFDAGEGALENGGKTAMLPDGYADYANIVLTRSATPPQGYSFVGWRVRGNGRGEVCRPGGTFTLYADDAKLISGKEIVYLDAVYEKVSTASIVYDANGGRIDASIIDYGSIIDSDSQYETKAKGAVYPEDGTAVVSGLANNSTFRLSGGDGFSYTKDGKSLTLARWSNQRSYSPKAGFYDLGGKYGVDAEAPSTLYAVWETKVVYHLNKTGADWGGDWDSYTYDPSEETRSQPVYLGAAVSEPEMIPAYEGEEELLFRYWSTDLDGSTEYDFSRPVEGEVHLYAYWSEPVTVAVHAVDASGETLTERTSADEGWETAGIRVGTSKTSLRAGDVTVPENYEFAFAAVHNPRAELSTLSPREEVTAIWYDAAEKSVCVTYGNGESALLPKDAELYYVYYQNRELPIGYKSMGHDGELKPVTVDENAPVETNGLMGEYYDMAAHLTHPLDWVGGDGETYTHYAFAVGVTETDGAQLNASHLSLITNASGAEDSPPKLRIQNTWRGFRYSTDDGNTWVEGGHDVQLYVVCFAQQPTVVMFQERTVGVGADMETPFTFDYRVTETTTTTTSVQKQVRFGDDWDNVDAPDVTVQSDEKIIFNTEAVDSSRHLRSGEADTSILFYSTAEAVEKSPEDDKGFRTVTTVTEVTAQTVVITQTSHDDFTTATDDGDERTEDAYQYTYTADGTVGARTVTFTNTRKSVPVEVHVAQVESDGISGGILRRDEFRTDQAEKYRVDVKLGESVELLEKLPEEDVFAGDRDTYAYGATLYGDGAAENGEAVHVGALGVVSAAYERIGGDIDVYELVLRDDQGRVLAKADGQEIYYLYYPMPQIQYVKEGRNGDLSLITGSVLNEETGEIEVVDDAVTYDHKALRMNSRTVTQNQSFEIALDGFEIRQDGNHFRMPPILDDGEYERYLSYRKIGAGSGGAANIDELDGVSSGLAMQLKVQNNTLQYSFNGEDWDDLPLSGTPTIYAIYAERGYGLQISKTVNISGSGANPIFSNASFTVTLRSMAITEDSYQAEGADRPVVDAVPAEGTTPGSIELTVSDGSKIQLKGLSQGRYTITEAGNENYDLSVTGGAVFGGTPAPMEVTDGSTVSLTLSAEAKVSLTNSPKALCKIGEDHIFYTLQSALDYVDTEIPSLEATIEMLSDYLMPLADKVVIPGGFQITLTTADSGFSGKGAQSVLTRGQELTDEPMFDNQGTLTLLNVALDGLDIEANAPVIQSAGDLTLDGSVIQNARNTGNGGAVNATKGDITLSSGTIINSGAANGGAIYHGGSGAITLSGNGKIQNCAATDGDGGAIYTAGGTITVTGVSSITGCNAANGRGGAVYADSSAVVTIDQNGSVSDNTARSGGAIYARAGTMTVSETEGIKPPSVTGNTATDGDGGAVWLGTGSIQILGGSVNKNRAENGRGGAVYADSASVEVSGTAVVQDNIAGDGGAVCAGSGAVTVSGGSVQYNRASTGNGGAVYAGSGGVTVSGGTLSGNEAGDGGAVYASGGNVLLSGGETTDNTARNNGGAVYALSGGVTLTCETLNNNRAVAGSGGAVYADAGTVAVTGTGSESGTVLLSGNSAGSDGGAVYARQGAVTLTDARMETNLASGSGGALYALSGNLTLAGAVTMTKNEAGSHGGAVYAGSGTVALSETVSMTDNVAADCGGAFYLDSGSATLSGPTMTGNTAVNGSAVFVNTGRAAFAGGTYTGNVSTGGGAVGVGKESARLTFSGNVQIQDNKLGTADSGTVSNVYLDQDSDDILSMAGLGDSASIGIYVPDDLTEKRDVPGARFASYISDANVGKLKNDRYDGFNIQKDTVTKKLFWGMALKVEVRYLASYNDAFPPAAVGSSIYNDTYYPEFSSASISRLVEELFNKDAFSGGLPTGSNAVYGGAFASDADEFDDYVTRLIWDSAEHVWKLEKHDGAVELLGERRIIIYYAEPAYISIENNTDMALTIKDLTVHGKNVVNSDATAGYGMVFAKNGAIRPELLPVAAEDLQLPPNASVNLLIPGGRGMAYQLKGVFTTDTGKQMRLRRTGLAEESLSADEVKDGFTLDGTTLTGAGTYNIIFGDARNICKIGNMPYATIMDAIAAVKETAKTTGVKTATIEMLTDYLLPASDKVVIPKGYNITLTTAAKEGVTYPYTGEGERATISRDSLNTNAMITTETGDVNSYFTLENLIFDGKSVQGNSDGGAVKATFFGVTARNVDFINIYASQGGALYVDDYNGKNALGKPNSIVEVSNCNFTNCNSTKLSGSRLGGGAIHAFSDTFNMTDCTFETCDGGDQAGAVFHRVDSNYDSWTNISNCDFSNCTARAAGALELDSRWITVNNCTFRHCVTTERNGGGFNIYALNNANPGDGSDCWVTVTGCTFDDCHAATNTDKDAYGGGLRSNARYTTVIDCSFTNTSAKKGGAIGLSNTSAVEAKIYGCTMDGCSATVQGGGIYTEAVEAVISDHWTDGEGVEHTTRRSEIRNCISNNEGGGIYHKRNVVGSTLTIENADITGNVTKNSGMNGGGVYTNARVVNISGSTVTDNICTSSGGGVYANSYTSLDIADSVISRNQSGSNGGGVYFFYKDQNNELTVKGSAIDGNTSGGSGGGIYTEAKTVTIGASESEVDKDGKAIGSSVSNNTAKTNGGGIFQNRSVDGSSLTLSDTIVKGCRANGGSGGGVYAGVRTLTATRSEISENTSTSNGGGVWFDINNDNVRKTMALTLAGCTLNRNTSGGNGGGVYTQAITAAIHGYTDEETDTMTETVISGCTAASSGGGLYHTGNFEESRLDVDNTRITGCAANDTNTNVDHGGGGIFANIRTIQITASEISGNRAVRNGGGVLSLSNDKDRMLTLDGTTVSGNTSGSQGGGVYARSQLTIRNGAMITGNRLTTATADNAAGVYMENNRTLTVGTVGLAADETDNSSVTDNRTSDGKPSNLRLWWNSSNKENNKESVIVNCNLSGIIGVVNAAKSGTQFGTSVISKPAGLTDDAPVFKADYSTLHGIVDRTDDTGTILIWSGEPIAKITDGAGNLLYLKDDGTDPAIFDRLYSGNEGVYHTQCAFNILNSEDPDLFTASGDRYTGTSFCVKMLVENYEIPSAVYVKYVEGRTLTFTTAATRAGGNTDDYPYGGRTGGRARIIRGYAGDTGASPISAKGNLTLENIIIDGGTENGITRSGNTRCLYVNNAASTVTLGSNAILQNGKLSSGNNGGGVLVDNGAFTIAGGIIRNCEAQHGGAVCKNGGQDLTLNAGTITQCAASGMGGAVYLNNGAFRMTGGTISDGSAAQGGAVYVVNGKSFYMSGGVILRNHATELGGAIAVAGDSSRLYFSHKVTIRDNTCMKDGESVDCNVEMNQTSKNAYKIINTNNGGLYPGSYIGVYVPGNRDDENPENDGTPYLDYGGESDPFGLFTVDDNVVNLYSFVNDRNGLKGGLLDENDPQYTKYKYPKNTIFWIRIFSLQVSKEVQASSTVAEETYQDEEFQFTVTLSGRSALDTYAWQIDSTTGYYGEMDFLDIDKTRNTSRATFTLKPGESIMAVNLPERLIYEVEEKLTPEQARRYSPIPNVLKGSIGENKELEKNRYTSVVNVTNVLPVCKLTDAAGNLLYRDDTSVGTGGNKLDHYYTPAVYTELTGDDGALHALEGGLLKPVTIGSSVKYNTYPTSSGVQIQMLVSDYTLSEAAVLPATVSGAVTLTTASKTAADFPYQGSGSTAAIRRGFGDDSMFEVSGRLHLKNITLDGAKSSYPVSADSVNGGIVNVLENGSLTIVAGATLQNSRITGKGGAVYVSDGGQMTMNDGAILTDEAAQGAGVYVADGGAATVTGGKIQKNLSTGDGAGIYLEAGSKLHLSGSPNFGGTGTDSAGHIRPRSSSLALGNFRAGTMLGTNGGQSYQPDYYRQDIFLKETGDDPASIVLTGNLTGENGSIWVWAEHADRYEMIRPFAKIEGVPVDSITYQTCTIFRDAQTDNATCGDNPQNSYLTGRRGDTGYGETAAYIYWSGSFVLNPVCKITDASGKLLYRNYTWRDRTYRIPAIYASLENSSGAFKAREDTTFYTSRNRNVTTTYNVGNNVLIQMLVNYDLSGSVNLSATDTVPGAVTLTTAATDAADGYPFRDSGSIATITRDFTGGSMFTVSGDLSLNNIVLDGAKSSYPVSADSVNGGIVNVLENGSLTIVAGATLQNSRITGNGGAVYVSDGGQMTMNDGAILTNEAAQGAGVYVADGGAATVTGGAVRQNMSTGDGAGVYLETGSTLYLSGNPDFGGAGIDSDGKPLTTSTGGTGNFKEGELTDAKNGGREYTQARQDIYLAEQSGPSPASIVLTGSFTATPDSGSIWVWAEHEEHFKEGMPFASFDSNASATNGEHFLASFRNARPDSVTTTAGTRTDYLRSERGTALYIRWQGSAGSDITFQKTDGFGYALKDVKFSLYDNPDFTGTALYEDTSADGTGKVKFESVAMGTYYMKETAPPEYNSNVYIVLVGDNEFQKAGTSPLKDISLTDIAARAGTSGYAIFLYNSTAEEAVKSPVIASDDGSIMNTAVAERKVILRKVDLVGDVRTAPPLGDLGDVTFDILRFDGSEVATGLKYENGGKLSDVIWIGNLSYGAYTIVERGLPTPRYPAAEKLFTLTVKATEVKVEDA